MAASNTTKRSSVSRGRQIGVVPEPELERQVGPPRDRLSCTKRPSGLLPDVARPVAQGNREVVAQAGLERREAAELNVPVSDVKLSFMNRRNSPPNLNV